MLFSWHPREMGAHANHYRDSWRRKIRTPVALLALGVAICLLVTGCGDGSSSSAPTVAGNSAEFLQPGSASNKIVKFGSEAPPAVRSEASEVLAKNLEARQAADFTTQCATLARKQVEQLSNAKGADAIRGCAKDLRKLAEPLPGSKPIRANQMTGPISALRLKGNQAFALFHGKDTDDYAVPMRKEGDQWKVAAIVTTRLGTG